MRPNLGPTLPADWAKGAHVARAPVADGKALQDWYLDGILEQSVRGMCLIGFHLNGPVDVGLGALGLGANFVPTTSHIDRALRFFDRARGCGVPLLVENANLYENSMRRALATMDVISLLHDDLGVGIILDLTHAVITAGNLGVDPWRIVGRIDPASVAMVHVSGLTRVGSVLHDGHDKPVSEHVWDLLGQLLPDLGGDVRVVLEHTDPSWAYRPQEFLSEFARLRAALELEPREEGETPDWASLASGYLTRFVLPIRYPALGIAAWADLRPAVEEWARSCIDSHAGSFPTWDVATLAGAPDLIDLPAALSRFLDAS